MGSLQQIKNNAIFYLIKAAITFFNRIPRSLAVFLGALSGYLAYLIFRQDRLKANHHLYMAFGDSLSPAQRKSIVRNVFINFGGSAVDVARLKKHYHDEVKGLIDFEGLEYFDAVYKRGRGIIAFTGHLGNFELMAAHIANSGYKVAAIGREMYDRRLNQLLIENRQLLNIAIIDTHDSPLKTMKLLKQGYAIGVLIDTDSFRVRSMFIPAFGRLSHTPIGQTIMGLRAGAGFVPAACIRQGKRYKVVIRPEVTIERTGDFEKDVYNMTWKCTQALETLITEYKDQWIWMHNRWLNRPQMPIE
ncbi:MAG: hypothetical protein NTV06_00755 [candidate division Zixibacteria bacterium]|nr:hypothetical protein [candidate division Zixibacteria bacterium]